MTEQINGNFNQRVHVETQTAQQNIPQLNTADTPLLGNNEIKLLDLEASGNLDPHFTIEPYSLADKQEEATKDYLAQQGIYPNKASDFQSIKPTETYTDENGVECKKYQNDDGSYYIVKGGEENNGFIQILSRGFNLNEEDEKNSSVELYDSEGNLVQKTEEDKGSYKVTNYDENGNVTKETSIRTTTIDPHADGNLVNYYSPDGYEGYEYHTSITTTNYDENGEKTSTNSTLIRNGQITMTLSNEDIEKINATFKKIIRFQSGKKLSEDSIKETLDSYDLDPETYNRILEETRSLLITKDNKKVTQYGFNNPNTKNTSYLPNSHNIDKPKKNSSDEALRERARDLMNEYGYNISEEAMEEILNQLKSN